MRHSKEDNLVGTEIAANGEALEQLAKFCYLGVNKDEGFMETKVSHRVGEGIKYFSILR